MSEREPVQRWGVGRTVGTLLLALVPAVAFAFAIGAWAPLGRMDRALVAGIALFPAWGLAVLLLGACGELVRQRPWPSPVAAATPGLSARLRVIVFRLHLELGGAVATLAFLLCFSGAAAVATRTLAAWEHAPLETARLRVPELAEQPLDRIVDEVLQGDPTAAQGLLRITPATAERPWVQVELRGSDGSERVQGFDPVTGAVLGEGRGPLHVLVELHRNLLVPAFVGEVLVASLGVLLAVVITCGLATRRRWRRELFQLRPRRLLQELHKLLGAWTFVFGIGAALTGAILGGTAVSVPVMTASAYQGDQAALFRDVLAVERPPLDETARARPPLGTMLEPSCVTGLDASHAWRADRFTLQHPGSASGRTTVEYEGPGPWLDRGLVAYDASGHAVTCRALRQQSAALQLFYATIALHYAEFGGAGHDEPESGGAEAGGGAQWLVEALWILAGLALATGAIAGEVVRQQRLERSGRAPGRWARGALVGLGVGLPLATVALLLLSRVSPHAAREPVVAYGVLVLVWAGAWASAVLVRGAGGCWRRARVLAACMGAGLLATAAASVITTEPSVIDLLWACMGAMILGGLRLSQRHHGDPRDP